LAEVLGDAVSMNACIEKAGEQAGEILDHLKARSDFSES